MSWKFLLGHLKCLFPLIDSEILEDIKSDFCVKGDYFISAYSEIN